MAHRNRHLIFIGIFAVLLCLAFSSGAMGGSSHLGVDFSWDGIRRCTGISPEIKLSNIPAGTVSFYVKLKDLDAPDYNHGGGKVPHDGSGVIPKKALRPDFGLASRYRGPCPPMGAHSYVFTVKALDADGKVLSKGEAMQPF